MNPRKFKCIWYQLATGKRRVDKVRSEKNSSKEYWRKFKGANCSTRKAEEKGKGQGNDVIITSLINTSHIAIARTNNLTSVASSVHWHLLCAGDIVIFADCVSDICTSA